MWKKVFFNAQNIEVETAKAVLVKMPNKSEFKGLMFWHPSKLVREEGGKGYHLSMSFTEDFEFQLFKTGSNYKKTKEITIDADTMLEAFGIVNEKLKKVTNYESESFLEVNEPEKIDKNVEVNESLKR